MSKLARHIWWGLWGGISLRIWVDVLIALYPQLWSISVAGLSATVAFVLYRSTLAPKVLNVLDSGALLSTIALMTSILCKNWFAIARQIFGNS